MSTDLIGYLYAATVAAGGIIGYAKAGTLIFFMHNFQSAQEGRT